MAQTTVTVDVTRVFAIGCLTINNTREIIEEIADAEEKRVLLQKLDDVVNWLDAEIEERDKCGAYKH